MLAIRLNEFAGQGAVVAERVDSADCGGRQPKCMIRIARWVGQFDSVVVSDIAAVSFI